MSDAITQTPKRRRVAGAIGASRTSKSRSRYRMSVPMGPRTRYPMSTMVTKRTIAYGGIGPTSLISSVPTLADFPGYTEFTALFDAYRIRKLTYSFYPARGNVGAADGSTGPQPVVETLTTAIDFNDNIAPTSQAELLEYGTCQQHFMDRPRKVSFVPRIKMGGTDVVTPSVVPVIESRPLFLSTDQAKIGHYGLKWAFSPTLQQTDTVVNVYIEAEIEFKLTK